ncbi:MAG: hypothetical protein OEL87_00155 [Nanoarchaeota archaeon]|nr:hypothetical protein [Nanoarchaeota archaeon]
MITTIIISIVSTWIMLTVIIPFLAFPNSWLRKPEQQTSPYIQEIANQIKAKGGVKTLKNAFNFIVINYKGEEEKFKLILYYKLFNHDIEKILKNRNDFLAYHQQNLLILNLLKETGLFEDEDIETHWHITKFLTLRQYLVVKASNQKFKVDPFNKKLENIKFNNLKYTINSKIIWQKLKKLKKKYWTFGKKTTHLENH